ncbi:MAG: hypothetical protein WCP36_06730 [Methanomicrobiales archaeon]
MGILDKNRIFNWFRDPENKKFTLVLLVLFCLFLEETIHLWWGIGEAYTHVFYILLVLAAIWYHERAVFLAIILGVMHIVVSYEVLGILTWPPLLRAMMFILVTAIVAVISSTKDEYQKELVQSKKQIEADHENLIAYITECANRLRHPIEIVHDNLRELEKQVDQEGPPDDLTIRLQLQVKNTEQIILNLHDLNQAILTDNKEIPDVYREFINR